MFELLAVNRDHAKYTFPLHAPFVRSTSIAVLSLNLPSSGDDDPFATVTEPWNSSPSRAGLPAGPLGFTKRATHWAPKPFAVPAGSPDDSEPKNARPWLSQAMTGSRELAVRICARAAYGGVSPGYPGTSELVQLLPESSER